MGPGAFFDLPWLPFYLAICFAFHVMIGLTALVGAIILVGLTVVTEYHVARAGARGDWVWRRAATIWPPPAGAMPKCWSRWACPGG